MTKRIYVIADDYRWHHIAHDAVEFAKVVESYFEVMKRSPKENSYRIFTMDGMSDGEIRSAQQMIDGRKKKETILRVV